MPRRGENVYKRKDGRWEGRNLTGHDHLGKAVYQYFYGRTYREVKEKMLAYTPTEATDGRQPAANHFGDVLDVWLRHKKLTVKESSYAKYYHTVNHYIRPHLGTYRHEDLTLSAVEDFVQMMLACGRQDGAGLSPKTVQDIISIIKNAVSLVEGQGVPIPGNLAQLRVKQNSTAMRVLSPEEQSRLTRFLLHETDLFKLGTLTCLYTGLRIGEVCALRWSCIDLEQRILRVRATVQRVKDIDGESGAKTKILLSEPKSKCAVRDIPLPRQLLPVLEMFRRDGSAFVLTGAADCCPEPRTLQRYFKRYVVACGLRDANFHALRHTFATRCAENGFEVKSLSEILGHANVNITLNRYVHSSFALKESNMKKVIFLTKSPSE